MNLLAFVPQLAVAATLDSASGAILYWVGNAVLYGSALALLTWALLSTALRRTRPTLHAAFWVLVIAKFLLPVGPGWSYSLSSLVSSATGWPKPEPTPAAALDDVSPDGTVTTTTLYVLLTPDAGGEKASAVAAPTAAPPATPTVSLSTILVAAYLVGLIVIASIRLAAYRRVARDVRKLPAADAATCALVRDVCTRLGQRGLIDIRISGAAPAPYVLGAWRPMLVLSTRNLVSREECEAVVLHELAHLRRHDLLVRYAQWLAGTVLYFWPVVAWVNRRIDLAREAACDEWALRHGRLSPAEYARCLLKCAQPVRSGLTAYAPAAMAANASHVERRIEMILDTQTTYRRSRMLALLGGAALCGWTGFALSGASAALPSNPVEDANKPSRVRWQANGNGPLSFFLPQVADSLAEVESDDADEDVVLFSAENADAASGNAPAMLRFIRAAHGEPAEANGQWIASDRAVTFATPPAMAGGAQVFVCSPNGQQAGVDLDGDGAVSPDEHSAYLLTLAMRDPAATLAKYPKADENGDGTLSTDEASSLLSGGFMGAGEPAMFSMALPGMPVGGEARFEIKLDGVAAPNGDATPTYAIAMNGQAAMPAGAPTDAAVQEIVLKALADSSAGRTFTIVTDAKCEDGGQLKVMPRVNVVDGSKADIVVEHVYETSSADAAAGAEAPKSVRLMKKIVTTAGEDGQPVTTVTEQVGDEAPKVVVVPGTATDVLHSNSLFVQDPVAVAGVPMLSDLPLISQVFKGNAAVELGEPPAVWLLQNAGEAPSAEDVRKYASAASEGSLKRFLKSNPRADANKDGTLTAQERDSYLEKKQSRSRERMLKRHPEADTNGDGLLSTEEMHNFFRNRKPAAAAGALREIKLDSAGEAANGVWLRVDSETQGDAPTVKVIRANEATDGPR